MYFCYEEKSMHDPNQEWWASLPIAGVGLIIIHESPDGLLVLTLQEDKAKPQLQKEAGSRSFPMETCKKGEGVHESLGRLRTEELPGMHGLEVEEDPAGVFEVVEDVWLLVWWATAKTLALPENTHDRDVSNYRWEALASLIDNYPNLRHGALGPLIARSKDERTICETYGVPS